MDKKSFGPRFINVLMLLVFCFLFNSFIQAQQNNQSEKSLADLFDNFKRAKRAECGQRDEAIKIGKEIVERFSDDQLNKDVIDFVSKNLSTIESEDKECKKQDSLENLFQIFKTELYQRCGKRENTIIIGEKILNLYGDDPLNQSLIEFVRNKISKIKEEERICRRNSRYNDSYKTKNWNEFFAVSKEIIAEEGDKPISLDVMLTLGAVGLKLTAYEKKDAYNIDTVNYAKKAIDLIEGGANTNASWGFFEPFNNKEKALAWLNYTVGYISYFRFKENKKAIPYFYKAATYKSEFKYDAFVYQAVAIHYFEKEAVTTSSLTINEFITKATSFSYKSPDGSNSLAEPAADNEISVLYKNLVDLYNLRYNLSPNENVTNLADYIQKLINRPLIDPSANVKGGRVVDYKKGTQ